MPIYLDNVYTFVVNKETKTANLLNLFQFTEKLNVKIIATRHITITELFIFQLSFFQLRVIRQLVMSAQQEENGDVLLTRENVLNVKI